MAEAKTMKEYNLERGAPTRELTDMDALQGNVTGLPTCDDIRRNNPKLFLYGGSGADVKGHDFGGYGPLREVLGKIHNVDLQRIIANHGGMRMVSIYLKYLMSALLSDHSVMRGKPTAIVERPSYDRVFKNLFNSGFNVVGVDMENDGPDLDHLKEIVNDRYTLIALFYGIPVGQNPTGINYSDKKIDAVEEIMLSRTVGKEFGSARTLWDGAYRHLTFGYEIPEDLSTFRENVVHILNHTKTVNAGDKSGYIVTPSVQEALKILDVEMSDSLNPVYSIQAWYANYLDSPRRTEFLNHLRNLGGERAEHMVSEAGRLGIELSTDQLISGYFVNAKVRGVNDDTKLREALARRNVIVGDSRSTYPTGDKGVPTGEVRMPFMTFGKGDITEIVSRVADAGDEVRHIA